MLKQTITVKQLDEGYLITQDDKEYGISDGMLFLKMRDILGITDDSESKPLKKK